MEKTRQHSVVTALCALLACVGSFRAAAESEPAACQTQATTVEMVACADWHFKVADRWLNQVYAGVRAHQDTTANDLLRDAQRAWLKYRDAQCLSERDAARGGTMASILEIDCRASLTEERAQLLSAGIDVLSRDGVSLFEKPQSSLLGEFKCDATILQARFGLSADPSPQDGLVPAHLVIGGEDLEWPIGGNSQDSFCGADLSLSETPNDLSASCPTIRIDDGLCDAVIVRWNASKNTFEWLRN